MMHRVRFTGALLRHVDVGEIAVPGDTVREILDAVFERYPQARGYVLDEQGALRRHMVVYVDGRPVRDRVGLGERVASESGIDIIQLLSGG